MRTIAVSEVTPADLAAAIRVDRVGDEVTLYRLGDPAPARPESPAGVPPVSAWQLRRALTRAGLREAVEAAVTASTDPDVRDGWEFATAFDRTHPMVIAMAQALGLADQQIDALFEAAAAL